MMESRVYVVPVEMDVLCGRGKTAFRHAGNHALRVKIVANLERYIESGRKQKTVLIHEIILSIMKEGGRFLIQDKAPKNRRWYDGGLEAAKNRVGAAFRDASVPGKVKCIKAMKASIQTRKSLTRCPSPLLSSISSQLDRRPRSPSAETYPMPLLRQTGNDACIPALYRIDCFDPLPIDLDDADDDVTLSTARNLLRAMGCGSDDDSASMSMLDDIDDIGDTTQASEYSLRLFHEMSKEPPSL